MSISNPTAEFLQTAFKEMRVREIKGIYHTPRIIEYHDSTTLHASSDEVPWCSSFVNWVVEQCGLRGTGSAWARSWRLWGEHCEKPIPGCIALFKRKGRPTNGHVAFFLYQTENEIFCLGGNQGDAVSISSFPKDLLICYRTV